MKEDGKTNETKTGNEMLEQDVARLFNSFFGEVLDILSSRFPHIKDDESQNEREFLCLRSKILRCGNNKIRQNLPEILRNFEVKKIYIGSDKQVIEVGQRVILNKEKGHGN